MTADNTFADDIFGFPYISEREMASERLVFNATEDILLAMQDAGVNKCELAKKLGKSASHVSQLLDGTRNMTLKTLSDISYALGAEARVVILKNGCDVSCPIVPAQKHYVTNLNSFMDEPKPVIKITIKPQNRDYEINVAQ
ncbi:transcriptional regulator [Citrobacter braakii]|uniref:helix-turn-helix transcriptional regulator n=1 Tax=Citrobacter TaxID=544 RepID=UPI001865DB49|nr:MULTISPECIES: helix-turn-helix transcriptional regulator [Citrobacter]MBN4807709.1 helix-turn-helix transcriptional regulator [Citrobacter braakii]MBN4813251.1 helix-turn-helix transcriptional regulator [Citrobacter braakii]MBN4822750.1 helix-turn-helix transcriptional regulator [Citrobacter braakii]MBN4836758.1 helix-turn-helix transcriptional regulator [Citrobacter braakii]MBN4850400.1 helix-turn-helix transcriptional regulator [Citrobacter braakii]